MHGKPRVCKISWRRPYTCSCNRVIQNMCFQERNMLFVGEMSTCRKFDLSVFDLSRIYCILLELVYFFPTWSSDHVLNKWIKCLKWFTFCICEWNCFVKSELKTDKKKSSVDPSFWCNNVHVFLSIPNSIHTKGFFGVMVIWVSLSDVSQPNVEVCLIESVVIGWFIDWYGFYGTETQYRLYGADPGEELPDPHLT